MFRRRRFRSPRVREARQRKHIRMLILFVVLVVSIVFMLSQASKLPVFRVETLRITGNKAVSSREIYDTVKDTFSGNHALLFSRRNVFLFSRNTMEQQLLDAFPRLKAVHVEAVGTHKVLIEITERQMVGMACIDAETTETCHFVDEDGFIFAAAPTFSGDSFFRYYDMRKKHFSIGTYVMRADEFHQVVGLQGALRELGVVPVSMRIESDNDAEFPENFTFTLTKDTELIFSTDTTKLEEELQNLQTVLLSDAFKEETGGDISAIEYIDLRFGTKVFYRLKRETNES